MLNAIVQMSLRFLLPLSLIAFLFCLMTVDCAQKLRLERPSGRKQSHHHYMIKGTNGRFRSSRPEALAYNEQIYNYHDFTYVTKVTIGSEKQEFTVVLDTGSADFWVYGSECRTSLCRSKLNKFNANSSKSFRPISGGDFTMTYGAGEVRGVAGKDAFWFGAEEEANSNTTLHLPNATVGIVTETVYFHDRAEVGDRMDGILGMGLVDLSEIYARVGESPPLNAAVERGLLSMFTIYLSGEGVDASGQPGGVLTLDGLDEENCGEMLGWNRVVPVDRLYYWAFQVESISYGTGHRGRPIGVRQKAIVDTGSPFIGGPPEQVNALYRQIGVIQLDGNGDPKIPCDFDLEPIVLRVNGQELRLEKDALILPADASDANTINDYQSPLCTFAIFSLQMDAWLFGDPFQRKYCTIHDVKRRRIALAPVKTKNRAKY